MHEQVLAGETVHVENLAASEADVPARAGHLLTDEQLHMEQLGGFLAIPLAVRERVFGSLDIYCTAGCSFSDTAITVLHAAADLAAVALENAQLHSTLFKIAGAVSSTLELQPMLKQVLESTVMEMQLKAASVRLLDKKQQRLELVAAHGLSDAYLAKGAVSLQASPIDRRVLAGEAVIVYDVAGEEGFQYPAEAAAEGHPLGPGRAAAGEGAAGGRDARLFGAAAALHAGRHQLPAVGGRVGGPGDRKRKALRSAAGAVRGIETGSVGVASLLKPGMMQRCCCSGWACSPSG